MKIRKITLNKDNSLGVFFFATSILVKGIGDATIVKLDPNGLFNIVKYLLLLLSTFIFYLKTRKRKKNLFRKEFNALLWCYLILGLISLFFSLYSWKFTFRTVKELLFTLTPIFFVYTAINSLSFKEFENIAKFATVVYIISYFIEIGSNFTTSVAIETITHFSLRGGQEANMYSSLESNAFPDCVMALFCFFAYYKKNNTKWVILTFLSIILMNKRLMVVAAIAILIFTYIPYFNKYLYTIANKHCYLIFAIFFFILPYFIYKSTDPMIEAYVLSKFKINLADFWMGRDVMVQRLLNRGYFSYGLGSTFDFQGSLLEIESLKFVFELTYIGWLVICYSYWKITRNHVFSIIIMIYIFLNMNTSTSLMTGAFAWVTYYYMFGLINSNRIME